MIKHVWAKVAAVAGTAALIVAGSVVGGTAAQAATLPGTDVMYGLNCDNSLPYSIASIDASTGAMTGVGQQTDVSNDCLGDSAYDPASGITYAVDWTYGGANSSLEMLNLADGTRTVVGQFYDPDNDVEVDVDAIAIDSQGNAYAVAYNGNLYSLNLSNGYLTYVGDTSWTGIYAFAFDNNDVLYGIVWDNGSNSQIGTIDTSNASFTQVGEWNTATSGYSEATSMAFDSSNHAWVLDNGCCTVTLWSITDMTNINSTITQEANPQYNGSNTYIQDIVITTGTQTNPGLGAEPMGGSLFAMNCDSANPYTLSSVSTTDAVATGVGTPTYQASTCFGQAAWDASTKSGYAVDWNYTNNALVRINFETGQVTFIAEFQDAANPGNTVSVWAIAVDSKGNAFATDSNGELYSLDLATARVTDIGSTGMSSIYALAFNPVNDKLYAIDYSSPNTINEINVTDATATQVGDTSTFPDTVESLQFTETGVAYFEVDNDTLWKGDILNVAAATEVGTFTIDGTEFYTESLVYIPGTPSLPDTGLNGVSATVGGLSVVFLIAAGAVLLVVRRRMAQQ